MFNKIIIVGNLTRPIELKYLPNGSALATIGLASNRKYKKQDGGMGEEVCFIDAKLFGRTAEVANQYLSTGSQVLIEGRLTLESWTDKNGNRRSKHTITAESMQMLGKTKESYNANDASKDNYKNDNFKDANYRDEEIPTKDREKHCDEFQNKIPEINVDEDEIPF